MMLLPVEIIYLFNCSIRTGIFPTDCAKGTITVIPNKVGNYLIPPTGDPLLRPQYLLKSWKIWFISAC